MPKGYNFKQSKKHHNWLHRKFENRKEMSNVTC